MITLEMIFLQNYKKKLLGYEKNFNFLIKVFSLRNNLKNN